MRLLRTSSNSLPAAAPITQFRASKPRVKPEDASAPNGGYLSASAGQSWLPDV
jgi:hypothetical protein